jgi:hypothetical protein
MDNLYLCHYKQHFQKDNKETTEERKGCCSMALFTNDRRIDPKKMITLREALQHQNKNGQEILDRSVVCKSKNEVSTHHLTPLLAYFFLIAKQLLQPNLLHFPIFFKLFEVQLVF